MDVFGAMYSNGMRSASFAGRSMKLVHAWNTLNASTDLMYHFAQQKIDKKARRISIRYGVNQLINYPIQKNNLSSMLRQNLHTRHT